MCIVTTVVVTIYLLTKFSDKNPSEYQDIHGGLYEYYDTEGETTAPTPTKKIIKTKDINLNNTHRPPVSISPGNPVLSEGETNLSTMVPSL